tara:strand:+ start:1656 stop:1793 length:138 start_codon:yes stop_codon:yes gene_type:complete
MDKIDFFDHIIIRTKNERIGDRTQDPQVKSPLLYLLSYTLYFNLF